MKTLMTISAFLLVLCGATYAGRTIYVDDDAAGTNNVACESGDMGVTVTASTTKRIYGLGEQVPIVVSITNWSPRPVYIYVDEHGFLDLAIRVKDKDGLVITGDPMPVPPPPPPYYYIVINGMRIFTVPVQKIDPGQTATAIIPDALNYYHGHLQEGAYFLTPIDMPVINEVGFIITRDDVPHPLWINPSTVISISAYSVNTVEVKLRQKAIIYVDADAAGTNDGSRWSDAYRYLQDALMMATDGDEIRVAQGIYKPDQFVLSDRLNLGRAETFQLKSGVAIRGGYAGFGAPDPNARDIEIYKTILSGDLNGNDVEVADPCDLLTEPTRFDNSYHIVTADGAEPNAILDGFIITGGNAYREWPIYYGGGMFIESGSPTVLNCTLNGNAAAQGGGLDIHSGSPKLINCTISNNAAIHAGGMLNGGINTTLTNCAFIGNFAATSGGGTICTYAIMTGCTFIHNFAGYKGGGIDNDCSAPILNNCVFIWNSAGDHGGGLSNYEGDLIITDCTFTGNWSRYGGAIYQGDTDTILTGCRFAGNSASVGGGIANDGYSDPTLTNCIFSGNFAEIGAGFYNTTGSAPKLVNCTFSKNSASQTGGGVCITNNYSFRPILLNCILWGNTDSSGMGQCGQISFQDGTPIVNYCLLQGWTGSLGGAGNIDADPCFAAPDNGDYHLKSQAGRWDPPMAGWIRDDVTSLCIDAGDPASPIGLEPFPNGGIINMGAYGGTIEASKSYFGQPICETIIAGDINGDCKVNLIDFAFMAYHWLEGRN